MKALLFVFKSNEEGSMYFLSALKQVIESFNNYLNYNKDNKDW